MLVEKAQQKEGGSPELMNCRIYVPTFKNSNGDHEALNSGTLSGEGVLECIFIQGFLGGTPEVWGLPREVLPQA